MYCRLVILENICVLKQFYFDLEIVVQFFYYKVRVRVNYIKLLILVLIRFILREKVFYNKLQNGSNNARMKDINNRDC